MSQEDAGAGDRPDHEGPYDRSDLWRIVASIKVAMMTTQSGDGTLRSRPMLYAAVEPDGHIWFFTRANSWMVVEVSAPHAPVNLAYADPETGRFVSLSGTAESVGDRRKIAELWHDGLFPWFPDGINDPELQLIHITLSSAYVWDGEHQGRLDF